MGSGRLTDYHTDGSETAQLALKDLRRAAADLQRCSLALDADGVAERGVLTQRTDASFDIDKSGRVVARLDPDSPSRLSDCIAAVVSGWRFSTREPTLVQCRLVFREPWPEREGTNPPP